MGRGDDIQIEDPSVHSQISLSGGVTGVFASYHRTVDDIIVPKLTLGGLFGNWWPTQEFILEDPSRTTRIHPDVVEFYNSRGRERQSYYLSITPFEGEPLWFIGTPIYMRIAYAQKVTKT